MTNLDEAKRRLHTALEYKPLNKHWAKVEILLGLLACGIALLLFASSVGHWLDSGVLFGLPLFALGGYLTLAGHRSHLYQSINTQTAFLLLQIDQLQNQSDSKA